MELSGEYSGHSHSYQLTISGKLFLHHFCVLYEPVQSFFETPNIDAQNAAVPKKEPKCFFRKFFDRLLPSIKTRDVLPVAQNPPQTITESIFDTPTSVILVTVLFNSE